MPYKDPIVRKQKSREAYLKRKSDPVWLEAQREYSRNRANLPEVKAQLKLNYKKRYANEEYRKKLLESNKLYLQAHPEIGRQNALRHRRKNIDKARRECREWHKKNRHKRQVYDHLKRARKRNATVNPKSIQIFVDGVRSKHSVICYYCEMRVSGEVAHIDHIIPLSKGGAHSVENLCVSCPHCNQTKHARLIEDWMRLGQQILSL